MNTAAKPKFTKYTKLPIIVILLALIALALYYFFKPKEAPPSYLTADAVMGDIENTVMASGKVKPIYSVDVGAQVSGRIVKLYVDVGDEVKKGDLIAQINQVEQKNTVSNAGANLQQAQASLAQAQANLASSQGNVASSEASLQARLAELKKAEQFFARLESLLKIDAISRQDYDDAQSAVEVARANVDVARAGVQNAKNDVATAQANIQSQRASINKAQNDLSTATEDLSYTTIVAPMDGTIVSVTQKEGTTVNAMQSAPTIVTLADLSRVRINAQISEADVVNVSAGMPARFNIIGNTQQQFDTTLAGVEPAPENISTTSSTDSAVYYIGYLDVDNAERKFRIDMTAQVNIITNSVKNVLTIPSSALRGGKGKYSVQVVGADGIAKPVDVQVGLNNRVNAEIKSGLNAGDKVVIGEASQSGENKQRRNRPPMMR
ncbi:efflux RND transporter periplasmic adaptor subunit [Moraxella ovis]|uniref:efflux RND transporter periplasmic adaptor subunit n=1 Tax=Moraxella ovis TaxID=29433 RepID=UPI000D85D52C|nr:efflux RND transporter periplasmic adaptor subunit [Moraxella ovis]SPX84958.1 Macrolide-specific efflux protein macA precursor [Moraxella ovis]STZ05343.1 Macrolide-specific efflux protein macA precursor [Moraxella ovis]